jgi:anti-sigma factor (TIGR02949 family)
MTKHALTCEEVLHHLFAYLDQELDAETSAEIERHLESCRGCFSRAEFEKRLKERVRETGSAPASEALHSRIRFLLDKF